MDDFKFGDLVECRDDDVDGWNEGRVFVGKKDGFFLVMTHGDYESICDNINVGRHVYPYSQCRKAQTKEYTMEELEKIVGHKIKIKE